MDAQIVDIVNEADGVVSLHLAPVSGAFPGWEPGAHIDLNLTPDLVRQYSLSGDPGDRDRWRVGILREPESRGGSQFVHEKLSVGDRIECGTPLNNFELVDAQEYLFIAGGIGVTPILPMIAKCEERGASWRMVYGGRNEASMAFTAELEKYGDKVTLWPQDRSGLIDLKSLLSNPNEGLAVYCCGPGVLLDAVEGFCEQWPPNTATLHLERFRPKAGALDGKNTAFEVLIDSSGEVFTVEANRSIAETLEAAGLHVPTSCREGTCGTCETGVLEGTPDHRDSYLTPEEKSSNEVMMLCCSRSCSKRLVLDL
ncbi:PDR/VanB family oxidoreductase [Arthrobacter sp. OAP107]|uniref:PDR/VanB family oxidoreductase n=1 Tax=Arthrobacter sp. OAP107 TaxID=3156445 RepID=UPI00339AC649